MDVILMHDVPNLGKRGDVVKVADGFARNYLIPRGAGLPATEAARNQLLERERQAQMAETRVRREAERLATQLRKVSLTARVKVGEEDKVFGRVTTADIASLLKEKGFDIDKKKIILDEPINTLGIFAVEIKLHPEVSTRIKLWVVKE